MVDEEIPLTKDIIREPPREFFPSFLEWLSDGHHEQVIESVVRSSAGTSSFYTVPENFTLFITSAWISIVSIASVGAAQGQATLTFGGDNTFLAVEGWNADLNTNSISSDYNMPLKLDSGGRVNFKTNLAEIRAIAGFIGFLLPKKISIR